MQLNGGNTILIVSSLSNLQKSLAIIARNSGISSQPVSLMKWRMSMIVCYAGICTHIQ